MKIILATGGSGGHIFPALHLAEELKEDGHQVYFVGAFGATQSILESRGYLYHELEVRGLKTNSVKSILISSVAMLKSIFNSVHILKDLQPDAIVGFGGYGAFPVVLSAVLLKYPTMIHEQNVFPGRANFLLAKIVQKVAISFEKSRQYLGSQRTILTGCPCRQNVLPENKKELLKELNLKENLFTILVLGGSQGSHRINKEFMATIPLLKSTLAFQIIHICGESDYQLLNQRYQSLKIPFRLYPFLMDIDKAYRAADLAISRAGAVTIMELAAFRLPAILIPYPFAGGHQKENAGILTDIKAAKMIEEKDLSPENLKELIMSFVVHPVSTKESVPRMQVICRPDAARRLANEVLSLSQPFAHRAGDYTHLNP